LTEKCDSIREAVNVREKQLSQSLAHDFRSERSQISSDVDILRDMIARAEEKMLRKMILASWHCK
jgi:hypothetical protein